MAISLVIFERLLARNLVNLFYRTNSVFNRHSFTRCVFMRWAIRIVCTIFWYILVAMFVTVQVLFAALITVNPATGAINFWLASSLPATYWPLIASVSACHPANALAPTRSSWLTTALSTLISWLLSKFPWLTTLVSNYITFVQTGIASLLNGSFYAKVTAYVTLSLCLKCLFVFLFIVLVRVTLPKFKMETLSKFGWFYTLLLVLLVLLVLFLGFSYLS